ncbi:cytochrome b/b6 domain-containing protein [Thalassococcus sp. BH17M4-6]|uniref:cytochrome b/b6 domain-containing protein n=1 Tax=Thalassococcus sp. BH17M4-6 TaxID=3413148 RepID=UPI003BDFCBC9
MRLTNTPTRYGSVTKTFHWLTVLGIAAAIPLGILANDAPYDTSAELANKAWLFSLHKTVGVTIFFVALLRILWALTQPKPAPLHPDRRAESWLAETVHWLLYGSLVLVPLTGWMHHAATTGFAPIWWPFGQSLPFVPKSTAWADTTAALHIIFERVLIVSIVLHVAGALKHHFVDRDATLRRMWFGGTEAGAAGRGHAKLLPLAAALVIWGAAVGIGNALGVFQHEASAAQVAALQEVDSDWQVQDGTLAITVQQMGSGVTGSFADWTADITFDQQDAPGKTGEVSVTVAIGSLTLGSVTKQAMGADFFNADQFPTARFDADINKVADGYEADGTLTVKDQTVPVVLPFQLTLEGDSAEMQGRLTLDRRDFAIGENMNDESQLGYEVAVEVELTATKGDAADE